MRRGRYTADVELSSVNLSTSAPLVLASRSPRRRALLGEHGVMHMAVEPGFDDSELVPGRVDAGQWVAALAYLKAWAAMRAGPFAGKATVLGADTACLKGEKLIGTPQDADEAGAMLRELSGGEHEVLTGVAMIRPDGTRTMFVDRATVRVGELGEDRIREYIDSKEWNGKAGGYNLRDRLDAGWPITFSGDPTSIMGLPMGKLKGRLAGVVGVATSSIAAEPVIVEAAPTTGAELSAGGGR